MSSLTILNRQNLVPDEKETDDRRHRSRSAVAEVATHRIAHHVANLRDRSSAGNYRMPNCSCDKSSVRIVLANLEDDLTHETNIGDLFRLGKPDSAAWVRLQAQRSKDGGCVINQRASFRDGLAPMSVGASQSSAILFNPWLKLIS